MKALQYLDKIIHLPFCIPPISESQRFIYLDKLLNGTDNSCWKTLPRLKKFLKVVAEYLWIGFTRQYWLVPPCSIGV